MSYTISATRNSTTQALTPGLTSVTVANNGDGVIAVAFGESGVTANDNDRRINPHSSESVPVPSGADYIAVKVCADGASGTVVVTEDAVDARRSTSSVGQHAGTTTNDSAAAGVVGEYKSSVVATGAAVSLTTATVADVTSLALTPGDWDVEGVVDFNLTGATTTDWTAGLSATSATLGSQDQYASQPLVLTLHTDTYGMVTPKARISIAANTTIYMNAKATFSAGTVAAFGTLRARRVR